MYAMSIGSGHQKKKSTKPFQVHVVFSAEAVYTIYVPSKEVAYYNPSIVKTIIDVYNSNAIGPTTLAGLYDMMHSVSKYGVYVFRYSKNEFFSDEDPEPINNWPKSIPVYIGPQEPVLTFNIRGVRNTQTHEEREDRYIKQAIQRRQRTQKRERLFSRG